MLALQAYTLVPRHVPYARYGHSKDISVMKFIMVAYIWLSYSVLLWWRHIYFI